MNIFNSLDGRVLCLFGELGDLVCENDLRIVNFNEFLSSYLKSAGFDMVVFYLSGGAMRTFDDNTAQALIGANSSHSENEPSQDAPAQEGESGGSEDEEPEEEDEELHFDYDIPASEPAAQTQPSRRKKLKYAEYVSGADFFPMMQQLLADTTRKSAIIFENIRDFLNVNQECRDQFKTLLHYLRSDGTERQKSIVIFQSMSRDHQQILQDMQENDILLSNFFYVGPDGAHPLERRFFQFRLPKTDEISNLLEHYRLFGDGEGHRLRYDVSELRTLAYLLEQCSQLGSSGTLLEIIRRLQEQMSRAQEPALPFGARQIQEMYPQVTLPALPLARIAALPQGERLLARMKAIEQRRKLLCSKAPQPGRCELQRFQLVAATATLSSSRFVIRGTQHSHRTEAAKAIADYLYLIGEVTDGLRYIVSGPLLLGALQQGLEASLRGWIREAKDGVLIMDDLEVLVEQNDAAAASQAAETFHRVFLEELDRNNALHFIFVIHSGLEERFFSEDAYARYRIPEKNRFMLTAEAAPAAEAVQVGVGRLSPEGR